MAREDFDDGDRVVHAYTGRRGVVVKDWYGACAREEVPVRYDGETAFLGTDWRELRKLDDAN